MNLNSFWPWKEIRRLESELEHKESEIRMHRDTICSLEQQLGDHVKLNAEKDKHMRKLGTILAMSKGISVLFLMCVGAFGQTLERNPFTTNTGPTIDARQYAISNVNLVSAVGVLSTNAALVRARFTFMDASNLPFAGITPSQRLPNPLWWYQQTNKFGFWIFVSPLNADGAIVFSMDGDTGNGAQVTDPSYLTNAIVTDSLIMGILPGYNLRKTLPVSINLATTLGIDIAPNVTNFDTSLAIGTYAFSEAQNCQNSFGLGVGALGAVVTSTNDFSLGTEALFGFTASQGNFAIGNFAGPNTSGGNSNFLAGNFVDSPVLDGSDFQMNINNVFWGKSVVSGGNTPATNAVVTFTGTALLAYSRIVATNGFASFATNINSSIVSTGFTNDTTHGFGTNSMMVHFIASVGETVAFYMRSGARGQTSCGTLLYTDTGITSGNYPVGINCGIALSVGTFTSGQAYAYP